MNTTISRLVRVIQNTDDRQYMPKTSGSKPAFTIEINEKFCKGCGYCTKYCPKDVFAIGENDRGHDVAKAQGAANCIGCLNCTTICPEAAITISRD